jgi:hypothetical protein
LFDFSAEILKGQQEKETKQEAGKEKMPSEKYEA